LDVTKSAWRVRYTERALPREPRRWSSRQSYNAYGKSHISNGQFFYGVRKVNALVECVANAIVRIESANVIVEAAWNFVADVIIGRGVLVGSSEPTVSAKVDIVEGTVRWESCQCLDSAAIRQ
jgi:hypothetical protein